ncbi:serpin-like protein, partial [Leptotrombidium deliense]
KTENKPKWLQLDAVTLNYTESAEHKMKLLELPYKGDVSMYIMLPNERYGLPEVLESIANKPNLTATDMKPTLVDVKIPAFEYGQQIDLVNVFEKLGIYLKSALVGLNPQLEINKAIQQTKIKTDDVGTEAAA